MYVYGTCLFLCLLIVVTVWGSVGMCGVAAVLKIVFFKPWSVSVCCMFV